MKANTDLRPMKIIARAAMGLTAAAGLLALTPLARADDSVTMAPPLSAPYDQGAPDAPANASADSVFRWTETPEGEEVTITRAVFDKGGYQLYDTRGETIVVPFTNQNLYVMKFAPSTNGHLYFINEGAVPVLYVPRDGYLENATVPGARWYPFSKEFHPDHPVYEGIAPSYSEFLDLGWYPHTAFYGGYYSNVAFVSGGAFLPAPGLFVDIGFGHPFYGWNAYHDYYFAHPAPYRVGYYHQDDYRFADRPVGGFHQFGGGHGFGGGHDSYTQRTFQGGDGHGFGGGNRTFTNGGGDHSFNGGGNSNGGGNFGGGNDHGGGGGFGGGSQGPVSSDRRSGPTSGISRGGDQAFGGRTFTSGGPRTFSGGESSGGGQSSGGSRSFDSNNNGGGNNGSGFGGGNGGGNNRGNSRGGGNSSGGGGFGGGSHVRG